MKRHKTVEKYMENAPAWQDELARLRRILSDAGLEETVKWGAPCYRIDGKNVVGLGAFKSYVGLWFFQGALLEDRKRVLVNAQDGKTKAMRQWRFSAGDRIDPRAVKAYVAEAVALQRAGEEIKPERNKPLTLPPELKRALQADEAARTTFKALSPGKRREYASYIAEAKRDATKASRLKKILPMIRQGQGLNDRYRGC